MSSVPDGISPSDILRYRRELLVTPLFWTSRHLDALGCTFQQTDNFMARNNCDGYNNRRLREDNQTSAAKNMTKISDVEMLAESAVPSVKRTILCRLLLRDGSFFNRCSKGPEFFFAGRPVHRPRYTVFIRGDRYKQLNNSTPPMVGYLDYLDVTGLREKQFRSSTQPGKRKNTTSTHLFAEKLSQLTPREWTEDPYFICVLLSIAQLQRRLLDEPPAATCSSRLLVANRDDFDYIYLYEGQFSYEFLKMLDKPTALTNCTNVPTIYRRRISFQPFGSFPERIRTEISFAGSLSLHLTTSSSANNAKEAVKRPCQHEGGEEGRNVKRKL